MALENSFTRVRKHRLFLRDDQRPHDGGEAFQSGWNDLLTLAIAEQKVPREVSPHMAPAYREGWTSCRNLLLALGNPPAVAKAVKHQAEEPEIDVCLVEETDLVGV
jgi:hypothetical protein